MVDDQHYADDEEGGLGDLLAALKRRRNLAILTMAIVFVVGAIIVIAWPNTYQSTATILLEEPEIPQELVQTTVTTFAAEQIQYINQRVMTRTNLANIIEKFNLYSDKRKYSPTLLLTDAVQENIVLDLFNVELTDPQRGVPVISTIAFTLGFEDPNPATAQKVANELVSLYMEENVRSRTVQTVETRQFLGEEVKRLEDRVRVLEQKIARFKEENEGSLPQTSQVNLAAMQRLDNQILEIDRELRSIDETSVLIDAQLAQIEPTRPMIMADGSAVLSPENQLKSLQTRLATLRGQYSEDHPDVARTRREIEAIRGETGLTGDFTETTTALIDTRTKLAKARENYGDEHPEVIRLQRLADSLIENINAQRSDADALVRPDNPAYIQLTAQKQTLQSDQNSLRVMKSDVQKRLAEYEQQMLKAPNVEQELIGMQRQLQSATAQYFAIRDRLFGAEMGEALESQSKGERFVLVEPPNLPLEPSSPNRPALLILLLVLSLALGIGLVPLKESLDRSIWGGRMVELIQGAPPIAEIPLILTQAEMARTRRMRLTALAGVPVAMLLIVLTVHFALKPLDVLWYVTMRKLGM